MPYFVMNIILMLTTVVHCMPQQRHGGSSNHHHNQDDRKPLPAGKPKESPAWGYPSQNVNLEFKDPLGRPILSAGAQPNNLSHRPNGQSSPEPGPYKGRPIIGGDGMKQNLQKVTPDPADEEFHEVKNKLDTFFESDPPKPTKLSFSSETIEKSLRYLMNEVKTIQKWILYFDKVSTQKLKKSDQGLYSLIRKMNIRMSNQNMKIKSLEKDFGETVGQLFTVLDEE